MLSRWCFLSGSVLRSQLTKVESPLVNTVRWKKRRWAPITPSKLFNIKERKPIDPEEYEELKVGYAHYRTLMRSLRCYFRAELDAKTAALTSQSHVELEKQYLDWCLSENNRWNEESARRRAAREKHFVEEKQESDLNKLIEIEDKQKDLSAKLRTEVLKTMEDSKHFISPDNLESAIELALNSRSDHCFVIDVEGKRYIEQPDGSLVEEGPKEEEFNAMKASDKVTENEEKSV